MDYMRELPDKFFALAIVDPPYGIGGHEAIGYGCSKQNKNKWIGGKWDNAVPSKEYFDELRRVSQNQIIWGGNYFDLPPTRCVLVWDKVQRIDMADCEIAWTSFDTSARIFTSSRSNLQGFRNPNRFHPTEKPIDLYSWICKTYAHGGNIFDSHLGSGSSRIACHKAGLDFVGCEIDKDYFEAQEKRFREYLLQLPMQFAGT